MEQTEEAIIVEADVTDDAGIAHVRNRWRTAIIPGGSKEGLMGGGFPSTTTWLTDTRIRISIEITGDAVDEDFMSMAGEHHRLYIFAEDTAGNESEWVGVDLFIPVSPYVQMQVGETKTCKALFNRDNMAGHQEFCLSENGEEAIEIQDGGYRAVKPGRVLLIYMGNTRGNMRSRIIQVKGGGGAVETPTGTPIPTGSPTGTPIPADTVTPSPLKPQTITGASSYTKVYGDKAFSLSARAGLSVLGEIRCFGECSWQSNDKRMWKGSDHHHSSRVILLSEIREKSNGYDQTPKNADQLSARAKEKNGQTCLETGR